MVKRVLKSWSFWVALAALVICLAAAGLLSARFVQAAPSAPTATYPCVPDLIVSANTRVVARCAVPYNSAIYWFAFPTTDSGNASRMLSMFETAKTTGSQITFYFDAADTSGGSYGCDPANCRAIWAVTMP